MSDTAPPRIAVTQQGWERLAADPARPLLALWADSREVYALLRDGDTALLVSTELAESSYPAWSGIRPEAAGFERMIHDLWGHTASGAADLRPWLDHGRWAHGAPLALRPEPPRSAEPPEFRLPEDLDQIPLGPVRGAFESPAHIRLGVRGETILQIEARLGYAHKAVLALIRGKSPRAAARFAARLAAEATVAHSVAFARATEAALDVAVPPRATALRDAMTAVERLTSSLEALAATAEAAGWELPEIAVHLEAIRRAANIAFGHRLMMDVVTPGGLAADIVPGGAEAIVRALAPLDAALPPLRLLASSGRLAGIGVVTDGMAAKFYAPAGDVGTRTRHRIAALSGDAETARRLLGALPEGASSVPVPPASGEGVARAAGPDGDAWHWLRLDHGQIASAFMYDPGWSRWALLQAMSGGGSLEELPVVAASLALSSSGPDL